MLGSRLNWTSLKRSVFGVLTAALVILIGIIGQDIWTQRGWTPRLMAWTSQAYVDLKAAVWPHGVYLTVFAVVSIAFWRKLSELGRIYGKYRGLRKIPPWRYIRYDKQPRERWEEISRVCYGHISYPGLLKYDDFGVPQGFGIRIIQELFNTSQSERNVVEIEQFPESSDWDEVLDDLESGKFDLVATPMLETFERSSFADFTMPMFFSNIGLYASSKMTGVVGFDGKGGLKDETLDSVVNRLSARPDKAVQIYYVPGEISEKQGRKLFDRLVALAKVKVELVDAGKSIITMLKQVEAVSDTVRLAFCESFHVQIGQRVEGRPYNLANILHPHHILYPVCYAVRNGDYVLRNRLNIGLLKMAAEGDGVVQRLSEILKVNKESLQAHFVSGWTDPRTREITA